MSQKSNKNPVKANTTGKIGTKYELPRQNDKNILPLTNENLNVFNIRNDKNSGSYNSSNSSLDNDTDDDDKTVTTNYASNPYGLTTPPLPPSNDQMVVDDYEPPATELLTREGKKMFYIINDKLEPVTSSNYNRDMTIYDKNGIEILRKEHLPENRVYYNDIMDEEVPKGGKRRRKTLRKTKRKIFRKIKRNTRRHKRRHTRKYK